MEIFIRINANYETFEILYAGTERSKAFAEVTQEEKEFSHYIGGGNVYVETWENSGKTGQIDIWSDKK